MKPQGKVHTAFEVLKILNRNSGTYLPRASVLLVRCSSGDYVQSFLGIGDNYNAYSNNAVSCPAGTRAVGIGARSSCYALTNLQVLTLLVHRMTQIP